MSSIFEQLGIPELPSVGGTRVVVPDDIDKTNVRELAASFSDVAITNLVEIARDGKTDAARVAACQALLDRAYGKVAQGALEIGDGPSKIRVEWV